MTSTIIMSSILQQILMISIYPAKFQRMVEQSFDGTKVSISKNVLLADEFISYLKNAVTELESKVTEQLDSENQLLWVKLSSLYILNFNLFGTMDKKLFKQLWDLNKKVFILLKYSIQHS